MKIKIFNNNDMGQNVYLYYDEEINGGFLIDAGCSDMDVTELTAFIEENDIRVEAVLLTHGHYDHIIGVNSIKRVTSAGLYCHKAEKEALENAEINRSALHGMKIEAAPDYTLLEGDTVYLFGDKAVFTVLHTPGHTPGSLCYYDAENGVLFSGDTLFKETIGRTDFPKGSHNELVKNLREKLLTLPDETKVYPGHGESTTIGHEKKYNPFAAFS